MADIFDNAILCNKCKKTMKPLLISKNGFNLRTLKCEKCGEIIVHPVDKQEYENFVRLKQKEFEVKMRMVGNSYAISIPREIVDFMKDQENMINNMVKLSFQEAGRLSLMFNTPEMNADSENQNSNVHSRVVKTREVHVVRNNKPVLHVKQFSDSAHPERNKNIVLKSKNSEKEEDFEEEEH
jgi:hypothetical protein